MPKSAARILFGISFLLGVYVSYNFIPCSIHAITLSVFLATLLIARQMTVICPITTVELLRLWHVGYFVLVTFTARLIIFANENFSSWLPGAENSKELEKYLLTCLTTLIAAIFVEPFGKQTDAPDGWWPDGLFRNWIAHFNPDLIPLKSNGLPAFLKAHEAATENRVHENGKVLFEGWSYKNNRKRAQIIWNYRRSLKE